MGTGGFRSECRLLFRLFLFLNEIEVEEGDSEAEENTYQLPLLHTWGSMTDDDSVSKHLSTYMMDTNRLQKPGFQRALFRLKVFVLWMSYFIICAVLWVNVFLTIEDPGAEITRCTNVVGSCLLFPCNENHNAICGNLTCLCPEGQCAPDGFQCTQAVGDFVGQASGPYRTYAILLSVAVCIGFLYTISYSSVPIPFITNFAVAGVTPSDDPRSYHQRWYHHICVWGFVSICTIFSLGTVAALVHGSDVDNWPPSVHWLRKFRSGFVANCASHELAPLNLSFPVVGVIFIMLSEIPKKTWGLDGFKVSLENALRSPPIASQLTAKLQSVQDSLRLAQIIFRLMGCNSVVLFWVQMDFWRAIASLTCLVCHQVIFNSLLCPFSETWVELEKITYKKGLELSSKESSQSMENPVTSEPLAFKDIDPANVFMDFTKKFGIRVVLSFTGQWIVLGAYLAGMRDDAYVFLCDGPTAWQFHNWVMWICVMIIQFLMTSALGSNFLDTLFDWYVILEGARMNVIEIRDTGDADSVQWVVDVNVAVHESEHRSIRKHQDNYRVNQFYSLFGLRLRNVQASSERAEIFQLLCRPNPKTRFIMDFLSNGLMYTFLIMIVPIALINNTDGMDFAKDCVAIGFITTADDLFDSDARATLRVPLLRCCADFLARNVSNQVEETTPRPPQALTETLEMRVTRLERQSLRDCAPLY
eukprot:CAMPEP_0194485710 /NCGR_PEP_ID=MMETSP0253-20130528/6610_1 /TAXON_ID=2966 /ORGANISM="Noctiluca scintillans" /LENGTH=700 /DNA_ID=CAMNT_0039325713 /DNA_START=39 /DNA_END=2141 /DNA_ORIENTATION=-